MIKLPSIHGEYTGEAKGEKFGKDSLNENIEDLTSEIKILNTNIKKTKGGSFGGMTSGSGSGSGLGFLTNPLILTGIATGVAGLLFKKFNPKFDAIGASIDGIDTSMKVIHNAKKEIETVKKGVNQLLSFFPNMQSSNNNDATNNQKDDNGDNGTGNFLVDNPLLSLGIGYTALQTLKKGVKTGANWLWNNKWKIGRGIFNRPGVAFNMIPGLEQYNPGYSTEELNETHKNVVDFFGDAYNKLIPNSLNNVSRGLAMSAGSPILWPNYLNTSTPLSDVAEHDVIKKLKEKFADVNGSSSYNKDLENRTIEELIKMKMIRIGNYGMSSDLLKEFSDKGVIDKSTKFSPENQEKILESILRAIIDGNSSYTKSASEISDKFFPLGKGYDKDLTELEIYEIVKKWRNADSKTEELEKAESEKKAKDKESKNVESTNGNDNVSQQIINNNNNNITHVHPPRPFIEDESFHRNMALMTGSYNSFAIG